MSQYTKLLLAITVSSTSQALFFLAIGWHWQYVYEGAGIVAGGVVGALWMLVLGARRDDRAKHEPTRVPAPRKPETDAKQPVTQVARHSDHQ